VAETPADATGASFPPGAALAASAPAKLNLFLEILGKRPDGFHELETVMVAVDWADRLTLRREGGGSGHNVAVELSCSDATLPTDDRNLVVRAAKRLLRDRIETPAASGTAVARLLISLEKHVPHGAGMGGGSSDAAAALAAVNRLLGLGLSTGDLRAVAAEIGSDVPYFVGDGSGERGPVAPAPAVCRGRGERIEPFRLGSAAREWALVVVAPAFGLATAEVYKAAAAGASRFGQRAEGSAAVAAALGAGDRSAVRELSAALFNRLEEPALRLAPALEGIKSALTSAGAEAALMTGSGSAVFGVCRDRDHAASVAAVLEGSAGRKATLPVSGRVRIVQMIGG
jgi:4-diphosphocytidyl-2-C-methyl-D-erythritol kinase